MIEKYLLNMIAMGSLIGHQSQANPMIPLQYVTFIRTESFLSFLYQESWAAILSALKEKAKGLSGYLMMLGVCYLGLDGVLK